MKYKQCSSSLRILFWDQMPCFPRKQPAVVQPEQTTPQYKNVHRYGETNIRHVNAPMKQDQWKKGYRDPNAGRRLPDPPQEPAVENVKRRRPPSGRPKKQFETEYHVSSTPRQSQPQSQRSYKQPLTADFVISVPIFNETLDHSYRKKNEYVYVDKQDDDISLYHQSLSRQSSLRDLHSDSSRRQDSLPRQNSGQYYRDNRDHRSSSLNRNTRQEHRRERRQKIASGSEASFNTYSSRGTFGYESETFEEARQLHKARSGAGLNVDSEDEDCR